MIIKKEEKLTDHPLEAFFDIEPNTTMVEYHEVITEPLVEMPDYDDKDDEIELKLEEIYSVAMGQVSLVADTMDTVEGKYKARVGEVTATMLGVALGAVREKRMMKEHKDKLSTKSRTGPIGSPITNNNLIVADRNEILRMLSDSSK